MPYNKYQLLKVGEGEKTVNGKTRWNDFLNISIQSEDEAFSLAMDILRQLESKRFKDSKEPITFNLTGTLYPETE